MTPEERFFSKVVVADGHWLWFGYVMPNGYGQFGYNGKTVLAHRWSYENTRGEIPDGLDIDHLCRVRRCVNPDHLEPVSRAENLRRGSRKTAQADCKNGHPLSGANLKPTSDGRRQCRECAKQAQRRYKLRRESSVEVATQPTQKETTQP